MQKIMTLSSLLILTGQSLSASAPAYDAQSMLFQLGYIISVDGAWGPQSQSVISQFYADRGAQYDGALDEGELADLADAISENDPNKPLLPIGQNQSGGCRTDLLRYLSLDVLTVDELQKYQAIPSVSEERALFFDTVQLRLYQWTAGVLSQPNNPRFVEKLVAQIENLEEAQVASRIGRSDILTDGSNETALLWQTDYLLTLAYAALALSESASLNEADLQPIVSYVEGLIYSPQYQNNLLFVAAGCTPENQGDMVSRMGRCQNHTYGKLHLRAIMGVLLDREAELRAAVNLYRYAIDDLGSDGALWREASRGAYSWNYYSHGLGHLVGIADLVSREWFDLWSYESSAGLTIHDTVDFYAASLSDPTNEDLMYRYAIRNLGIDQGRRYDDDPLNLDRFERTIRGTYYSEWLPVYRDTFPESISATSIGGLLRDTSPPETTYHYGLNTWCVYEDHLGVR
jgi:hypothetical protein